MKCTKSERNLSDNKELIIINELTNNYKLLSTQYNNLCWNYTNLISNYNNLIYLIEELVLDINEAIFNYNKHANTVEHLPPEFKLKLTDRVGLSIDIYKISLENELSSLKKNDYIEKDIKDAIEYRTDNLKRNIAELEKHYSNLEQQQKIRLSDYQILHKEYLHLLTINELISTKHFQLDKLLQKSKSK